MAKTLNGDKRKATEESETPAGKRRRVEETTSIQDLPSDMLFQIFSRLEQRDILSLSLVSKTFLPLTNPLIHKLTLNKSYLPPPSVFARFSSVTRLTIRSNRILRALSVVASYGFKIQYLEICGKSSSFFNSSCRIPSGLLEMLRLVRCLKFQWWSGDVAESEVVEFIRLFESLQELDLSVEGKPRGSFEWTDSGIEMLALMFPNLRKVNLDYNLSPTARSLDALTSCCVDLEHISVSGCYSMTLRDIWSFLHKATNLKSLELSGALDTLDTLTRQKAMPVCEKLTHLTITGGRLTDTFLLDVANLCSSSPLTALEFKSALFIDSYTMEGVSAMLRTFQRLTRLHLCLPPSRGSDTQDTEMSNLVKSLPFLKDVFIFSWSSAYATLFSFIRNCHSLERIHIKSIGGLSTRPDVPCGTRKNYSIRCIYLDPWPDASTQMALKSRCPSSKLFM